MNARRLIIRSLLYYWRTGVVVAFGVAVATAVIVGSLVVGDSVSGSIRDASLARLGSIDQALVAPHFFRSDLAGELAKSGHRAAAVISIRGTVENAMSEAAVPNVGVVGVDSSFWKLYDVGDLRLARRGAAVSASLARDLRIKPGDSILVNVDKHSAVPSGTLFAHKSREDTLRSMRLDVAAVLPDLGPGGFRLDTGTDMPRNVFVLRERLAEALGKERRANVVLVDEIDSAQSLLCASCTIADYGLKLVPNSKHGYLSLQSEGMLLGDSQVELARKAAGRVGATSALTSVYLATTIRRDNAEATSGVPYSIVAGVESVPGSSVRIPRGAVVLNSWAADDLGVKLGDRIELTYLVPNPDGTYRDAGTTLTLAGVASLSGPTGDHGLVPVFEGITDAGRIDEWNAPFPIDLNRIRSKDEEYWDNHRATPKAFVSLETAREMWKSGSSEAQVDWVTSVRIRPQPGVSLDGLRGDFTREVLRELEPEQAGMVFRPVRALALRASQGTTDFGRLFLGMSFFLVVAGAGLAGMLMRLSADRRASEVGIVMACGFNQRKAVGVLVGEGFCLAMLGAVTGTALGILYAWGIISALTSWWIGAVGTSTLWLHLEPGSAVIGGLSGLAVGLAAVTWGARTLSRRRVLDLLAGRQSMAVASDSTRRERDSEIATHQYSPLSTLYSLLFTSLRAFAIALATAAALVICSTVVPLIQPQIAFFGCGAALLVAGLAFVDIVLASALKRPALPPTTARLALRGASANRVRSLLVVGLIACASFVIVAVAANTRDFSRIDFTRRDSGTGGFALRALSSLPIRYDLGSPSGRASMGFFEEDEALFDGVEVMPLMMSPGEDISCLNLAKPSAPRIVGVSPEMVRRGGFSVQTRGGNGNPWRMLEEPDSNGAIPVFGDADSVRWTLHSGIDGELTVDGEDGSPVRLRIVGLVRGSIFAGELLMSEANLRRVFPSVTDPRYFLIGAPPDKVDEIAESLRRTLGDMGMEARTTREVLNSYMRVQNTYLSVFLALGGLGLLLGTVGMVAVLLRTALERRREFALMLAVGGTTSGLARLLIMENAGLLACGLACGTVSALVAVAPHLASAESRLNWLAIAGVLAAVAVVGLASCAVAAGKVASGALVEALREE